MQIKETELFSVGSLMDFSLSKNDTYLALGGSKGEIVMYNLETDKAELRITIDASIESLAWAASSGLIVGDSVGSVYLFL
jgi:WD40 repeat protein